jgi:DNA-directed RNA polymerase II subunit RPB1
MSAKQSSFKNPSRIIGIQFGLFSPEEIRKAGVVEVVSKDTYIGNSEVAGGLFDPRMGVLGPNTICPTDGLTNIMTPGYFGYIELARPVFFIQHLKEIMKILKCVCFKCSKLLISKEQHRQAIHIKASFLLGGRVVILFKREVDSLFAILILLFVAPLLVPTILSSSSSFFLGNKL